MAEGYETLVQINAWPVKPVILNLSSVRFIVAKMFAGGRDSSVPVPKCP